MSARMLCLRPNMPSSIPYIWVPYILVFSVLERFLVSSMLLSSARISYRSWIFFIFKRDNRKLRYIDNHFGRTVPRVKYRFRKSFIRRYTFTVSIENNRTKTLYHGFLQFSRDSCAL